MKILSIILFCLITQGKTYYPKNDNFNKNHNININFEENKDIKNVVYKLENLESSLKKINKNLVEIDSL